MNKRISIISPIMCLSELVTGMTTKMIHDIRRSMTHDSEFIVVDNASTHGKDVMRDGADIYVRLPQNRGWGGGLNVGMKIASGEFFVLANCDIEIEPGWAEQMIERFESNPKIGTISINSRGGFSGAFFAIRREIFDTIGGFDEVNFPLGHAQDCDYLYRLMKEGWDDNVLIVDGFKHHIRQTYNQPKFKERYSENPNYSRSDFMNKWNFPEMEWEARGHRDWEARIKEDPSLDRFGDLEKINNR